MADDNKLRIVMFPWLAFGHLIPYLQFARLIAQKGHHVFFVSTPRNIHRLPKLHNDLLPFITFVKLTLPPHENLPDSAEATSDVPRNMVKYLKIAYDGLRKPMADFLQASDPDWILHDFSPYWLGPISSQLGIKTGFFSIYNPEAMGLIGPIDAKKDGDDRKTPKDFVSSTPAWIPFTTSVSFQYFDEESLKEVYEPAVGVSDFYRFSNVIESSDIIAVRGSYEFQPEWFQLLNEIYRKPVIPVGHLPATEYDTGEEETETWGLIKSWLDKQDKESVIYIAFGSETKPNQRELTEIALGLEQSMIPFIWVFINRRGQADSDVIELPEGFEDRTKGRGLVVTTWAPQLKILAHESVGGFLTHAGSSSIVEGIQFEVAFISLSFSADQGVNGTVLAEKKLGRLIPRDEHNGSFTRNSVAECIRMVMIEEEGKIYRENVKKIRGLVVDRERQESYVVNFLDYLQNNRNCKKNLEKLFLD